MNDEAIDETEKRIKELLRLNSRFGHIIRSAPDGIIALNGDYQIVVFNAAAERIFGYAERQVLGQHIEILVPDSVRDVYQLHLDEYASKKESSRLTIGWRPVIGLRSDGKEILLEVSLARIQNGYENLFVTTVRSLADASEIERRFTRLQYRHNLISNVISDIAYVVDMSGRLLWWNNALQQQVGDSIQGRNISDFIKAPKLEVEKSIAACLARREIETSFPFITKNGTRDFRLRYIVLADAESSISNIVVIGHDITDETRLKQTAQQAQQLQTLGQLTGGIAHDFNNVLTSIMGYCHLAREKMNVRDTQTANAYLDEILNSATRAASMADKMLDFTRGGSSKPQFVDLPSLVNEVLAMLHSILPEKIQIELEHAASLPPVFTDPVQAYQVVVNLCINARDAMYGEGVLSIRSFENAELGLYCSSCSAPIRNHYLVLEVRDTGAGVSPDALPHIFEPFFSTKPRGKGAGMGLAMVHGIMHELGGHVIVSTKAGKGTSFRVFFPKVHEMSEVTSDAGAVT